MRLFKTGNFETGPFKTGRFRTAGFNLAATALAMLAIAGCQQKSEQAVETKVCANLAAVGAALEQVSALKPTSTIGEATTAKRALSNSLAALNESEAKLEKLRIREFRDQLNAFNREADRITRNKKLTLEEAAGELKTKAEPVIAARRRVSESVKCPGTPDAAEPAK